MKYAVIQSGNQQYIVTPGQELEIDLVTDNKQLSFEPLLVFDEESAEVGAPVVSGITVTAEVVEPMVKGDKIKVFKFKAKKRVKKLTGHRQKYTLIRIGAIGDSKATAKAAKPAKKPAAKKVAAPVA